jgi:hypothetical protein
MSKYYDRHFSVIKDRKTREWVLRYGSVRYAIAYTDYDGELDRQNPTGQEWIAICDDFNSIQAWHGEYKMDENKKGKVWGKVSYNGNSILPLIGS